MVIKLLTVQNLPVTGTKGDLEALLRIIKRKANTAYILEVFKPLLEVQQTGIWVQIGNGSNNKKMLAIPVFVCISGDHAELYKLIGSAFLKLSYKCRICEVSQVEDIGHLDKHRSRNDDQIIAESTAAGLSYKNRLLKKAKKVYCEDNIDTKLETACRIHNVAIQWEQNELYTLFRWPLPISTATTTPTTTTALTSSTLTTSKLKINSKQEKKKKKKTKIKLRRGNIGHC